MGQMGRWAAGGLAAMLAGAAQAAPVPRTAPVSGTIVAVKSGEQETLVGETAPRPAEAQQKLKAGDVLRTNAAGTLAILFADGTQIRLGRNSILQVKAVAAGAPSALQLAQGSVWGRSPRGRANLSVETPSATAAIRGTDWALTVAADATALQVFDGKVSLANERGAVEVAAGEAARAATGQAPVKVVLADPVGREQMLYFLRAEDAKDLAAPGTPGAEAAFRAAYEGDLTGALDLARGKPELAVLQARIELLLGRPEAARASLARASPGDARTLALSAEVAADYGGDPYGAIAAAERAIRTDPALARPHAVLAAVHLERGAETEALAAIEAAIARDRRTRSITPSGPTCCSRRTGWRRPRPRSIGRWRSIRHDRRHERRCRST